MLTSKPTFWSLKESVYVNRSKVTESTLKHSVKVEDSVVDHISISQIFHDLSFGRVREERIVNKCQVFRTKGLTDYKNSVSDPDGRE